MGAVGGGMGLRDSTFPTPPSGRHLSRGSYAHSYRDPPPPSREGGACPGRPPCTPRLQVAPSSSSPDPPAPVTWVVLRQQAGFFSLPLRVPSCCLVPRFGSWHLSPHGLSQTKIKIFPLNIPAVILLPSKVAVRNKRSKRKALSKVLDTQLFLSRYPFLLLP